MEVEGIIRTNEWNDVATARRLVRQRSTSVTWPSALKWSLGARSCIASL